MILLSMMINKFKHNFLQRYKNAILPGHLKALWAMEQCRQEHGPKMLAQCTDQDCAEKRYIPHSCGHRNCPHCQNHESQQWIENQLDKRLPAEYYLITFTLPKQLRNLAWRCQKIVYSMMFDCVQDTLKTFTKNDKILGGTAGFTAILHTHSRRLDYHPHIHVVMPGASINMLTGLWKKKTGYLFNKKALAKVFRAKMLKALVDQGFKVPGDCPEKWVAHCKNVGNGDKAIIYLGRYLYRGVIQEKDILRCEDGSVTFRYQPADSKQYKIRTVSGEKFLYLLMLHVLPKGFRRTRSYGFLHPCSKKLIKFLQVVLRVNPLRMLANRQKKRPAITCPVCGAEMKIIRTRIAHSLLPCPA
jgi:hypothetical protein